MLVFSFNTKCPDCAKDFKVGDLVCTDQGILKHEACKEARWTQIEAVRNAKRAKKVTKAIKKIMTPEAPAIETTKAPNKTNQKAA